MRKWALLVPLAIIVLASQALVFAESSSSHEIDHVETNQNCRIVFYKDGTRELFVYGSAEIKVSASSQVYFATTVVPPFQPDFWGILNALAEISGIASLISRLRGLASRFKWWLKHRKSATPVVIFP